MRKVFVMLLVLVGFGFVANAQKSMFKVTVQIQKTYHYFDENGKEIGTTKEAATPYVDNYCAATAEAAKDMAKSECQGICSRDYYNSEGKKPYNGKYYECKSTKEVWNANAQPLNQSCQ